MLRKFIGAAALVAAMAGSAVAQGGGGGGQRPAPRDHWMTLDSLVAAVGVTDSQKASVKLHLDAINVVYKARMDAMAGGTRPDSAATAKSQADADAHYGELRKLLNAAQQTKFDALTKPRFGRGGGGRRGGE